MGGALDIFHDQLGHLPIGEVSFNEAELDMFHTGKRKIQVNVNDTFMLPVVAG